MVTNVSLEDLVILAENIRAMMYSNADDIFERSTIRDIARTLEKDNPNFTTLKGKLKWVKTLLETDDNYLRFAPVIKGIHPEDKYNKEIVKKYKKFFEIFTIKYTDLPLHINDIHEDFTKVILNWRLKIGK